MISNVYSYYMSEYGIRPYSKHNAHKKSELKDIYNNIVKINRFSPFYKLDISEASQRRAIDIKENAKSLLETAADLTDAESGNMTFKSIAQSSDSSVVSAEYIGDNTTAGASKQFTLEVKQLASPQVNTGTFLNPRARNLFSGTYSFEVNISSITYELQFSVKDGENNQDIQDKLAKLINRSNIGLKAEVNSDGDGRTALSLTSNMTGLGDKPVIFTVTDDSEDRTALSGAVEALGLNNTSQYPSNAVFELNGERKVSSSNNFTVDREFSVTLQEISKEGEPVTIGLKQNMDSLVDSLHELADDYNQLTALAKEGTSLGSRKLYGDLTAIASSYREVLDANGLSVKGDGLIEVDDTRLRQVSDNGGLIRTLSQIGTFKSALQNKARAIMINPMEYINKSVISYKNPLRPSVDPYTTSIYTGMMYNGYC